MHLLKEIYDNRNILSVLVRKNLVGQYNNSKFGFLWHFISPFIQIMLYYFVLSPFLASQRDYWIFLSIGVFPFFFLQSNVANGAASILANGELIKKIYFPREIITLANVLANFISFLMGYIIVIILVSLAGYCITLPLFIACIIVLGLMLLFAYGVALLLATVTTYFHDLQHFISVTTRVFFWVTPIFAPITTFAPSVGLVMRCNPFTYYIESCHAIFYYNCMPDVLHWGMCVVFAVIFYIIGICIFKKHEKKLVEYL